MMLYPNTPGKPLLQQGFTLIETLVVMSLLAVIMVSMGTTLRTMAQTETRVDERLQRNDQMRIANNFLRKVLARVDAVKINTLKGPRIEFAADQSSISWTGIMPARYGAGGRYFFHLALEDASPGMVLMLRYTPWSVQTEFPDWAQSESHILATHITSLTVECEGLPLNIQSMSTSWPVGWQAGWPVKDAPPQRVRLMLTDQKGQWPTFVIALNPTLQSQPATATFVIGGT